MTVTVIGVDPGGRYAGIVVRRGSDTLVDRTVLDRRHDRNSDLGLDDVLAWARFVAVTVDDLRVAHGALWVAAEGVKAPSPHVRRRDGNALTNVAGILDTAVVLGALGLAFVDLIVVDPGGNGALPDYAYPEAIRSGTRGLGGPPVHARAAWDVAGAAIWRHRTSTASREGRS